MTRALLHTRQAHPALHRGSLAWVEHPDNAVLAYWRIAAAERVLCLFNLSSEAQGISLNLPAFATQTLVNLLNPQQTWLITELPVVIKLRPQQGYWLLLQSAI